MNLAESIEGLVKFLENANEDVDFTSDISNLTIRLEQINNLSFLDKFLDIDSYDLDNLIEEACIARGLIELAEERGYGYGYELAWEEISDDYTKTEDIEENILEFKDFLKTLNLENYNEIGDYLKHYPLEREK